MGRKLRDSVVVITGASSGIGRATALRFARAGSCVALAARRAGPLRELALECERLGAPAIAVPTDVTDPNAVRDLARHTAETWGRIDAWVSNAGVYALGRFEETPRDVFVRVLETNLLGVAHGAWAALPYFREQGGGTLIHVGSVFSLVGAPYVSAYVASKFAVRGFSECLRAELRRERVRVSTVMPAAIDTPLYEHTANFTGRKARPLRPVSGAEAVAAAIVRCAARPRREVIVGRAGPWMVRLHDLLPGLWERLALPNSDANQFLGEPQGPTRGNLYAPMAEGTSASGGWRGGRWKKVAAVALPAVGLAYAYSRARA